LRPYDADNCRDSKHIIGSLLSHFFDDQD
jgi:hypothetical protein